MSLILLLLWGVGFNVGLSVAEMKGGQALTNQSFPESVFIQNKEAPHETQCLGSIFNSFTIFTADTCKLDVTAPNKYRIMPAEQASATGFDVTKAKAFDVVNITTYVTTNLSGIFRTKIIHIGLPGMVVPADGTPSRYVTAWDDLLDIIIMNRTGIGAVMSSSVPPKAGAIHFEHPDTPKCNSTYNGQREQDWPKYMLLSHFCIFESTDPFNSSLGPIVPGMPCEDSVGSPIFATDEHNTRVVMGILLVSKCTAPTPFAIGINSAEFTPDEYFTDEPSSEEPSTTKWTRPPPRTAPKIHPAGFVKPTGSRKTLKPFGKASAVVVHLPVWCAVIFSGAYLGL